MKSLSRASVIALGLFSLSSCALPPREAWRVIQHDGLIPYISVEMGKRPVPTYVKLPAVTRSRFVTVTPSAKAPGPAGRAGGVYVARPAYCLPSTRFLDHHAPGAPKPPVAVAAPKAAAHAVPSGSTPPRRVPTVTPKPAARPVVNAPAARPAPRPVVSVPVTKPAPRKVAQAPVSRPTNQIDAEIAAAPKAKAAPSEVAEKPPAAKPAAPTERLPTAPPPVKPVSPPVVTAKAAVPELPFGAPIPGRPGLVNSPYAGKYQLVDVTGLSPGQEVKCPYTGKLFRVPGALQATNGVKSLTEPPPPPAKKAGGEKKP